MSILKVSIRQIKAARALLGWSQDELAGQSGVSVPTVKRLESADRNDPIGGRSETGDALVVALEKAGVEFIAENGGGAGVRLARRAKRKPSNNSSARAAELASEVVDHHTKGAPDEERVTRKRRIIKGPSSFRDVRKDRK